MGYVIECEWCGESTVAERKSKKFCSQLCAQRSRRLTNPACEFAGCGKPLQAAGLCAGHYRQRLEGRTLTTLRANVSRMRDDGTRQCYLCEEWYPLESFYTYQVKGGGTRYGSRCFGCHKLHVQASRFNKSVEWLLEQMERGCSSCGAKISGNRNFHIDHDHTCCPRTSTNSTSCGMCVRGVLCQGCNLIIGWAKDDITRLQMAIEYLRKSTNDRTNSHSLGYPVPIP